LSKEHFSVDGTLIEALASLKSYRRNDEDGPPGGGGRNPAVDFHGEKRSRDTHESTTDKDALLFRLVMELRRDGVTSKAWTTQEGRVREGKPIDKSTHLQDPEQPGVPGRDPGSEDEECGPPSGRLHRTKLRTDVVPLIERQKPGIRSNLVDLIGSIDGPRFQVQHEFALLARPLNLEVRGYGSGELSAPGRRSARSGGSSFISESMVRLPSILETKRA